MTPSIALLAGWLLSTAGLPGNQAVVAASNHPTPLFAETSTLDFELETDLRALWKTGRQPGFQPGILRWRLDGASGQVAVGVTPRGRFRRDRENCQLPPLFLKFPHDANGPFAGQDVLPVTTHCQKRHGQYVVQEYLAYRSYALLTEYSVAVRLARARYVDASGRGRPAEAYAFLMEHFEALAARVGATVAGDLRLEPEDSEAESTTLVDLFQYLIGNTDWSTIAQHNVVILRSAAGDLVPVPYDFDFAGVIDAAYAVPSEKLAIRSVRQRVYRGFCRPDEIVLAAIRKIQRIRPEIYALYRETPELEPRLVERALGYYDEFFQVVESPEALRREILGSCR